MADDIKIDLTKSNNPSRLHQQIQYLVNVIKNLRNAINDLRKENKRLKRLLDLSPLSPAAPSGVKPPFIKPETDKKKNAENKGKGNGKPGRKPGFKGTSRTRPEKDEINGHKEHSLESCPQCGDKLKNPASQRKRIIIDIRIPKECDVIEHNINQYWCRGCRSMKEEARTLFRVMRLELKRPSTPRFRQWCVAHFLREFKKIEFRQDKPPPEYWKFTKKVMRLFRDALSFSKRKKITTKERASAQKRFLKRLDEIVSQDYRDKDVLRLVKRLVAYREGFFTSIMLKNYATNNFAERTIRFAVLIRKVVSIRCRQRVRQPWKL